MVTRQQLRARARGELEGLDLVNELLAERRRDAEREDAALGTTDRVRQMR